MERICEGLLRITTARLVVMSLVSIRRLDLGIFLSTLFGKGQRSSFFQYLVNIQQTKLLGIGNKNIKERTLDILPRLFFS
jgi:hypothetical protein